MSIVSQVDQDRAEACGINASIVFVRPDGGELQKLKEIIEEGELVCPALEEMELDDVIPALEKIKTEHTRGKIVLRVKN